MKKLFTWLLALFVVCLLIIIGLYTSLHTKYAPNVVNFVVKPLFSVPVEITQVEYSYKQPRKIILKGITLETEPTDIHIEQAEIVLAPTIMEGSRLHIEQLTTDKMTLSSFIELPFPYYRFYVETLAFNNLALTMPELQSEQVNITLGSPSRNGNDEPSPPFEGQFHLDAESMTWQGNPLSDIKADGYLSLKDSYADLSFSWKKGRLQLKGKKSAADPWYLSEATIDDLELSQAEFDSIQPKLRALAQQTGVVIKQLNIADFSGQFDAFSINQLNLTAANIELPLKIWQQDFSLDAKAAAILIDERTFTEPELVLTSENNNVNIENLMLETDDGGINIQGLISPSNIALDNFSISNMNWKISQAQHAKLTKYASDLTDIEIKSLFINAVTITPKESTPKESTPQEIDNLATDDSLAENNLLPELNFAGLDIAGENIILKQDNRWGLWQGFININAETITYQDYHSELFLMMVRSENGHVWVDKLFAPINDGLLEGTADINFADNVQPWRFDFDMTGLPLSLIKTWNTLPFKVDAIIDGKVSGNGLYGEARVFKYSVTGELDATISDASTTANFHSIWENNQSNDTSRSVHDIPEGELTQISIKKPIHITADRGRISIEPIEISAGDYIVILDAKYDFLNPETGYFNYRLNLGCQAIEASILDPETQMIYEDSCVPSL